MKLNSYDKNVFEKIQSLPQGFYLSYDSDKKVVLTIKSIAGLTFSLVQGCPISLALSKEETLITLYIIDNETNPQYFKGNSFSNYDLQFQNFETIVLDLLKATEFKLILLNETHYEIANATIKKENSFDLFTKWIDSEKEEFEIQLSNRSFVNEKKLIYIDSYKNEIWNNNLINGKPYFNFNEYLDNGKHGYNQEFSIKNILSEFYEPNLELFPSLLKVNGEELTDFLIIYEKAVVLIESKYTISPKQTMFNKAITKAISQLNSAEKIIFDESNSIDNELVNKELLDFQVILKLCIFYDDGRNLESAFQNISKNYDPSFLPIFISISTLVQYTSYFKILNIHTYKYNIIDNLLRLRKEYRIKNKIIVIDGFDINTNSITVLE